MPNESPRFGNSQRAALGPAGEPSPSGARRRVRRAIAACGIEPGTAAYSEAMTIAERADLSDLAKRLLRRLENHATGAPGTEQHAVLRKRALLHLARRMVGKGMPLHARFLLALDARPELERDEELRVRLGLAGLEGDDAARCDIMHEIWALPHPSPETLLAYERHNTELGLSSQLELFRKRWGATPVSIESGLANATAARPGPALNLDRVKFMWSVSESGIAEYQEFLDRAVWGHLAADYLRDLVGAARSVIRASGAGRNVAPGDLAWAKAIIAEIDTLLPPFPADQLEELTKDGCSLVACVSHSGLPMALEYVAHRRELPFFRIGLRAPRMQANPRRNSLDPRRARDQQLLRLAREARARPIAIGISPDGQFGDRLAELPFLGRTVFIGQGAPALAYLARARTVFLAALWNQGALEFRLRVGPSAEDEPDRSRFFAAWNAFYLGCLREILLGAPENLRFAGGIWRTMKPGQPGETD